MSNSNLPTADAVLRPTVKPGDSVPAVSWSRIPRADLGAWNERLLETASTLFQAPCYGDSHNKRGIVPVYVTCGSRDAPAAYASVLTVGYRPFRLGLVQRGPVLIDGAAAPEPVVRGLLQWARRAGYTFLVFSHWDAALLELLASQAQSAERVDAFPFFRDWDSELVIDLDATEEELLASFQPVARRNLKAAQAAGYEVRVTDTVESFIEPHPML